MSSWNLPVLLILGLQTCIATVDFFHKCWGFKSGTHGCGVSSFVHQAISPTLFNSIFRQKAYGNFFLYLIILGYREETKQHQALMYMDPHAKMCKHINKWRALIKWWPFSFPSWLRSLLVSGIGFLVEKAQELLWIRLWFHEPEMVSESGWLNFTLKEFE